MTPRRDGRQARGARGGVVLCLVLLSSCVCCCYQSPGSGSMVKSTSFNRYRVTHPPLRPQLTQNGRRPPFPRRSPSPHIPMNQSIDTDSPVPSPPLPLPLRRTAAWHYMHPLHDDSRTHGPSASVSASVRPMAIVPLDLLEI